MLSEQWRVLVNRLAPVTKDKSEQEKRLELITGGIVRCWSLDNPDSVRGQKCARAVMDEACLVLKLEEAWNNCVRPTLTDLLGDAVFLSTPRGRDFFWQLYNRGQDAEYPEWMSWQFPTISNPYIDPSEVEAARVDTPEIVFRQEYLAEFIEDGSGVFRNVEASVDIGRVTNIQPFEGMIYYMGVDLARVQDFTVLNVVDQNGMQVYHERFNQISWERQIAAIVTCAKRYNAKVFVDSTGLGDPIFERLRNAGLRVSGFSLNMHSKEDLINNLAMMIEQGRIRLMDIKAQTNELLAYEYELTPSKNIRMNAPSGMHDDCVIALALAIWGLQNKRQIVFG